ncbi:DUF4435 domain-containing protein [Occultella kanbiaonis]|uniref:DUF4435 domain-containing protein n=1 Tax=Occultella kanbiaonis TaxID=2675754 RepID=UPI0013D04126|nr:DUF4435 domain-containing protein [Occultella kanbiaonis]
MTSIASSLRQLDQLADRIRLHRQLRPDPIVIVEGPTDKLVLKEHIVASQIFPASNKNCVLATLVTLSEWGDRGAIGIVDTDFDDPSKLEDFADQLYPYNSRDLEAMLIELGTLAMVLEHQGSEQKLARFGGAEKLIQLLIDAVASVTALRYANARNNWGLAFDKVKLADKFDRNTLQLKVENYCAAISRASESDADTKSIYEAALSDAPDDLGPRGRDVLEAAGVALRKVAGSLKVESTSESVLTSQLHSSAGLALSRSDWLIGLKDRLHSLQ